MMRKSQIKGYIILGLLFVLVSTIAFVIPTIKSATFWFSYIFTIVAFFAQIAIWKISFNNSKPLKSIFWQLPVIYIAIAYLVVQVLAFFIFTITPTIPTWISIVVCIMIAAISCICIVVADIGKDKIEEVENYVQKKALYIRKLQADVELLADNESNDDIRTRLTQLAEKIRYSDPISNEQLESLEDKISSMISELKTTPDKLATITEISKLLDERNKKCKILK